MFIYLSYKCALCVRCKQVCGFVCAWVFLNVWAYSCVSALVCVLYLYTFLFVYMCMHICVCMIVNVCDCKHTSSSRELLFFFDVCGTKCSDFSSTRCHGRRLMLLFRVMWMQLFIQTVWALMQLQVPSTSENVKADPLLKRGTSHAKAADWNKTLMM